MSTTWIKLLLIVSLLILVPVLPFLVLGDQFETVVENWIRSEVPTSTRFYAIVAVLAVDIFLPIPSSAVSTYGGGVLGVMLGIAASWLGMTIGSIAGFWLSRRFGHAVIDRWVGKRDADPLRRFAATYGAAAVVLTRPLPILAEACVLLAGAMEMPWKKFLGSVSAANLAIATVYSVAGYISSEHDSLFLATVLSCVIPLSVALVGRRLLSNLRGGADPDDASANSNL